MIGLPESPAPPPPGEKLLTFRAGGWPLLLSLVLVLGAVTWRVLDMRTGHGSRAVGDGRHTASYGFDLSACLIPRDQIVPSGLPKDGLPTLNDPPMMSVAELDEMNRQKRAKYLVPGDRVIGVAINGQARAYPVRVLTWHEVVNDTLGGVPIAVTYHPLCDSAVVFDRRVNGETLTFGFSGLLYNSNLLMFDRRDNPADESLWSQLQWRAVAGPAAASDATLTVLPALMVRLDDWRQRHPTTQVLAPEPAYLDRYKRDPYVSYYGSDALRYPVQPLPPPEGPANKTPVVAIGGHRGWTVFALTDVADRADATGTWRTSVGDTVLTLRISRDPLAVGVWGPDAADQPATICCFWFAWYGLHPDAALE